MQMNIIYTAKTFLYQLYARIITSILSLESPTTLSSRSIISLYINQKYHTYRERGGERGKDVAGGQTLERLSVTIYTLHYRKTLDHRIQPAIPTPSSEQSTTRA